VGAELLFDTASKLNTVVVVIHVVVDNDDVESKYCIVASCSTLQSI
jgi:hypothetical protein